MTIDDHGITDLERQLRETATFLEQRFGPAPSVGIVLGSGYAWLGNEVENAASEPFAALPHYPVCTNKQHPGRLVVGNYDGVRVVMLVGRIHCYEGYRACDVAYAVRSLALWGVQTFVLTNAAGAINPAYRAGEFMVMTDHINLIGQNPLTGHNLESFGPRFPDISSLYTPWIRQRLLATLPEGFRLHAGVYGAMPGPSYESPAEIRMLHRLGADAVGMSTVPEAIALGHIGRNVFGLSCLTNLAAGIAVDPIRDEEIKEVLDLNHVQENLRTILRGVLHVL